MTVAMPAFAKLRPVMWGGFAALLALPLIAMRFTGAVRWGAEDFIAAALLLGGLGAAIEIAMRVVTPPVVRAMLIGSAVLATLLLWADAAVGIF